MKFKLFFLVLLAQMFSMTALALVEVDGIVYYISGTEATVTGGTNISPYYIGDIVIPETISRNEKTYTVTGIDDQAFYNSKDLTSITIPNTVTSIGSAAFIGSAWYNNQPDGLVYAGKVAYKYKGTMPDNTTITIKDGTLSISARAFYGCSGLNSINIPNSVTTIGSDAFDGTTWYNNQPKGLVYAGKVAYKYKGTMPDNTVIRIKDGTLGIGDGAFWYKNPGIRYDALTSVTIPNSVTRIGDYAFEGCGGLTSITIGNGVTRIGEGAFSACIGLTSITIPKSVITIGKEAFQDCRGLTSITIPERVTSIGYHAFEGCKLTSVTYNSNSIVSDDYFPSEGLVGGSVECIIGDQVTRIGAFAFSGCGFTSFTIPESVTDIGYGAFKDCIGLTSITIPKSVITIGEEAFYGCRNLTSVTISEGVTSIGINAFRGCTGLTSITIPESVKNIGYSAFYNCRSLTSVHITDLETWCSISPGIPNDAAPLAIVHLYLNGQEITDLMIPDGLTSIGDNAFFGYSGLTSVTIPNSVTRIGMQAFGGCSGLTSVTIPKSVTSIDWGAFSGCSDLTSITSLIKEPFSLWSSVFRDATTATLYVPQGTKELYEAAEGWKEFTGRIVEMDLSDIETMEGRSHEEISVYDLSGRNLVGKSQRGINIIRTSNGKTRKVLVK